MLITVEEARKLLEGVAKDLTDEQVEQIITDLEFIACLAIGSYKEAL